MINEWAAAFTDAFSVGGTPVEQQVYAAVLGDEHPAELDTYSCLTRDELARMTAWLAGPWTGLLVDVGCGRGGPGVWVASRCGAQLVGLDVTNAPFDVAASRADRAGVDASFRLAPFADTGLADDAADAVLSVDVLQFVDSPVAAFAEVARILRPGGRLALTAAEHVEGLDDAMHEPPRMASLARAAGLEVAACDSPPGWPATARRISEAMLHVADDIAAETDSDPGEVRAALERLATHRRQERRVLLLASKPT
jgi:SAM-dependent methyltransferase